jgi:DNA gyrase/topoisomerase IV subunit A
MAFDFDKIRTDINEIIDTGDKAIASSKILDLHDYITTEQATITSEHNSLNEKIKEQEETIAKLQADTESLRAANADVMLKYGDIVSRTQPVFKEVKEEKEEKPTSWEDIINMK